MVQHRLHFGCGNPAVLVGISGHIIAGNLDWKWGFSTCVPLDEHYERATSYVTKYITKGEEKIFGKWYFCSRNLIKKPDIVTLEPISYHEFRDENKLKVHIQNETEIYPSVYMISEELPELESEKNE